VAAEAFLFGPSDCVDVSRSARGTCVFKTQCDDRVANIEFSFVCENGDEQVEHIFDKGALTASDELDTNVKCLKCLPPTAQHALVKEDDEEAKAEAESKDEAKAESAEEAKDEAKEEDEAKDDAKDDAKEEGKEEAKDSEEAEAGAEETEETAAPAEESEEVKAAKAMLPVPPSIAAFYGPSGCIATYRSPTGSCVVQTSCSGVDMSGYQYGLTCVDDKGDSVRHMFGEESFDAVETFDSLIDCSLCLGLDAEGPPGPKLKSVTESVATLTSEMDDLHEDVQLIKDHLDIGKEPAEEGTADEEKAEEAEEGEAEAATEGEAEAATEGEAEAATEGEAEEAEEGETEASLLHTKPKVNVAPRKPKVNMAPRSLVEKPPKINVPNKVEATVAKNEAFLHAKAAPVFDADELKFIHHRHRRVVR